MKERLQKLMSMAGVSSRRGAEELIRAGRVRVNGKTAAIGDQADLAVDTVEVDGVRLNARALQARVYYAIYKPRNVLASRTERHDDERKTVFQFVPYQGHLFSIGRLDADSDGLVVLTNDGEMAQRLSHPRYKHTKTYRVVVEGLPTAEVLQRWENGIFLEEGRTAPCYVRVSKGDPKETVLHLVMTEGKKRQIRRVASILGHPVIRLTRVAIGSLDLGRLKPGEFRVLDPEDIEKLKTPAPELKTIRARRTSAPRKPARTDDSPELLPRGAGMQDDVRSERQRRSAREQRPLRDGDAADAMPARRPYDAITRPGRPSRRPAGDASQRDDQRPTGGRPARAFRRPEGDTAGRPSRRPAGDASQRDDQRPAGGRPARVFRRPEGDTAGRPSRRPAGDASQRDDQRPAGGRPARVVRRSNTDSTSRPSKRPGSGRRSSGNAPRPSGRRPTTRRRRDG